MFQRITFQALPALASGDHPDKLRLTSYLLLAWSLLYAIPHLYWGLGGAEAHSVYKPSASQLDTWAAAHLFAFALMTLTGTLGFAMAYARDTRYPRLVLFTIAGVGAAMAAAHGLYGIFFRAASVTGITDVEGVPFDASRHDWVLWDLLAIEPWFLMEGVLLGLLGYFGQTSAAGRKRWAITVSGLFVVFFATAALSVKVA